ncbi:uncharacterized protein LOC110051547 [Orbicella faveolata]|uniref:uncharacterized protein LOC110051547 n=1 Tax=Orbicella faveolata TaxID=48498 RepID=UPI0009E1C03C|nr:uncharacterized protein LOC110051547 [Orbicella faveolata]
MGKAVVVDEFACLHKCIENHKCKSLNVQSSGNKSEVICELNNKTRQMTPDAFQRKQGSTYYGSVEASGIKWDPASMVPQIRINEVQTAIQGTKENDAKPLLLVLFCKQQQTYCSNRQVKPKGRRLTRNVKRRFSISVRRGWFSHQPGHSCKDIRDSGDAKGDGEYWIDPENNTNSLLVYCDMTTDDGKLGPGRTWRIFVYFAKVFVISSVLHVCTVFLFLQKFCQTVPNFKGAVVLPRSRKNFC